MPETLILEGNLELLIVPVKSVADKEPLIELAVIIPVVLTFPDEASTEYPFPEDGFCPT